MSAEQLAAEGDRLREASRHQEAIYKYDAAIAADPSYGWAYAVKAFSCKTLGRYQEAEENYKKAFSLGQNQSWMYHDLGFILTFKIAKREEALTYFNKAQENGDSDLGALLLDKGNCLIALGKIEDAKRDFLIAIQHNSNYAETYSYYGGFLEEEGKKEEALRYYNIGLTKNANDLNCGLLKAALLDDMGRKQESLEMYRHLLNLYPSEACVNYRMGSLYASLGNQNEAKQRYETAASSNATSVSALCAKGQAFSMLGRHEEAMAMYKKAQAKLNEPNGLEITLPTFLKKVKIALKAVLEVEEASEKIEAETAKLNPDLPAVKKFLSTMKGLQEKKIAAQNKVLDQVNKKDAAGNNKELAYLDQIKQDFQKELAALKREMSDFKSEVTTEIKTIKNNMDEMKEELNSKMDDFHKKLDIELNKQDLSNEDKLKLKAYFKAFIGTFSSAHVSAQVVDSGMVQLDSESSTASVLSFMASFAPFVGSALETGIKSIGDFLATREMKANARKLKGLAPDAVVLSQIIGKTGFTVLTDRKKQQQVLTTTDKQLNELTGNIFKKIFQFCEQVNEKVDVYLYTNLYKTTQERIGHNDANELIEAWTSGKVMPYDIDSQFSDHILKALDEEKGGSSPQELQKVSKERNGSCNMF